jgi:hypothetical protein
VKIAVVISALNQATAAWLLNLDCERIAAWSRG